MEFLILYNIIHPISMRLAIASQIYLPLVLYKLHTLYHMLSRLTLCKEQLETPVISFDEQVHLSDNQTRTNIYNFVILN